MVSEPQITRIIGLRHSVKETSWLTTNEATCGGSRLTTNEATCGGSRFTTNEARVHSSTNT